MTRTTGGEPRSGGTVSFATYNGISSLDPADRQDGGATGGSEMAAIYDLLMRFDTSAGEYVPPTWLSRCRPTATTRCGH